VGLAKESAAMGFATVEHPQRLAEAIPDVVPRRLSSGIGLVKDHPFGRALARNSEFCSLFFCRR